MVLKKIKDKLSKFTSNEGNDPEYIEIDLGSDIKKNKVLVQPFIIRKYEDVNEILNVLREGYSIAVIDIREIKKKDMIDLKRVIAKIKKTTDALEGSIAGFGENVIIATPSFAEIQKAKK